MRGIKLAGGGQLGLHPGSEPAFRADMHKPRKPNHCGNGGTQSQVLVQAGGGRTQQDEADVLMQQKKRISDKSEDTENF
jgi:hypothetical protein